MEDARLILASQRDPAAFRLLYDRWAERLLPYFSVRVRAAEVAADLLAETFAVAYERRNRFSPGRKSTGTRQANCELGNSSGPLRRARILVNKAVHRRTARNPAGNLIIGSSALRCRVTAGTDWRSFARPQRIRTIA